jgi:hypothetical protein
MCTDINKLLEDMRSLQDQLEQFFDESSHNRCASRRSAHTAVTVRKEGGQSPI